MNWRKSESRSAAFAEVIDLGVSIDVGAPLPHLVSDGMRAVVVFHAGLPHNPDWNGRSVTMVEPGDSVERNLGWVMFDGVYHVSLGPPNDEALAGHPLHGSGLDYYSAHEVRNSALVAEFEMRNRVHPHHDPERPDSLIHMIVTFHDETLECLCRSWSAGAMTADFQGALAGAAAALRTGTMPPWSSDAP